MSETEKSPDPFLRNLREALVRDTSQSERPLSYSTQRLQPTVVPPPPSADYVSALPLFDIVSPDDDIEPDHAGEMTTKRRRILMVAASVGLIGMGGLGYVGFNRFSQTPNQTAIPEIKVDLAAQGKVAPQRPEPVEGAGLTLGDTSTSTSMGQISTELVPPTTDGLSPARKINATRIIVENDLEVRTLK